MGEHLRPWKYFPIGCRSNFRSAARLSERVPRNMRDAYYIGIVSLELLENYHPSKFNGNLHLFMMDRGPLVDGTIGWDKHNEGEQP